MKQQRHLIFVNFWLMLTILNCVNDVGAHCCYNIYIYYYVYNIYMYNIYVYVYNIIMYIYKLLIKGKVIVSVK